MSDNKYRVSQELHAASYLFLDMTITALIAATFILNFNTD